jgi:hypothetical protein
MDHASCSNADISSYNSTGAHNGVPLNDDSTGDSGMRMRKKREKRKRKRGENEGEK